MKLAKILKQLMNQHDLSATELANKSGVSNKTIHNWLTGQSPKNVEQVKAVADTLEVSMDFLLFGEEAKVNGSDALSLIGDEWVSGVFEVKVRRVK